MIFWTCIVTLGFVIALASINTSFKESYNFPIISMSDSISVKDVPFPAVTIDAGKVLNPWGLVQKFYRFVEFECYESPYDCPKTKKAPLQDLGFVIENVVSRFFDIVVRLRKDMDLHDLVTWHKKNIRFASYLFFPEFDKAVAMLACIINKKSSRSIAVRTKLARETANTFAMFSISGHNIQRRGWGSRHFYPIVTQEAGWYGVTEKEIQPCLQNKTLCPPTFKEAYVTMLLPFVFNRVPYDGLSLGDFLSYFTNTVLTTSTKTYDKTLPFLNGWMGTNEHRLADLLAGQTRLLLSSMNITSNNVTFYELSKLMGYPLRENGTQPQAYIVTEDHNCLNTKVTLSWWRAWEFFVGWNNPRHAVSATYNGNVDHPPCVNATLDSLIGITGCCAMTKPFKRKVGVILSLMKYAIQSPHFTQSLRETENDLAMANEYFMTKTYNLSRVSDLVNTNPRVFTCKYNGNFPSLFGDTRCNIFKRSLTNEGFGYTFNSVDFWSKHNKKNQFNHLFFDTMFPASTNDQVYYPEAIGVDYGLFFTVQLSRFEKEALQNNKRIFPKVRLAIHDPKVPADLRGSGIDVQPGYVTTFFVTPNKVKSSDDMKAIEVERRGCMFDFENGGLNIFANYTQKGCQFECSLNVAAKTCQCVPWNYPQANSSLDTCDYMGVNCFERVSKLKKTTCRYLFFSFFLAPSLQKMAQASTTSNCDCPADCNLVYYTYSMSAIKLNSEAICWSQEVFYDPAFSETPMLMRNFERMVLGLETGNEDVCKRALASMAFVRFQLAGDNIVQINRSLRVTLADHIANLGIHRSKRKILQDETPFESLFSRWHIRTVHRDEHNELLRGPVLDSQSHVLQRGESKPCLDWKEVEAKKDIKKRMLLLECHHHSHPYIPQIVVVQYVLSL